MGSMNNYMNEDIFTDFHDCYEENWRGMITDESFAHPAKFSRGLIQKILKHGLDKGYWDKGETILDPFGGIASGGVIAAYRGIKWIGCELEQKFYDMALANFKLHERTWTNFKLPQPQIFKGDSRYLTDVLKGVVHAVVSSPPYAATEIPKKQGDDVYPEGRKQRRADKNWDGYGDQQGQLGAMKEGTVDSIVSSPPYAKEITGDHGETETASESRAKRRTPGGSLGKSARHGGYGKGEGQLSGMKEGTVEGVVSSPPFMDPSCGRTAEKTDWSKVGGIGNHCGRGEQFSEGNMYHMPETNPEEQETFWGAGKMILQQCHALLKPGGVTAWIVKDFVRAKKRVDFAGDWCKLLEACGFEVFERTRCWLVKERKEHTLFGTVIKKKERKSFFRRLAEKKGSPEINWEEVIWARKVG